MFFITSSWHMLNKKTCVFLSKQSSLLKKTFVYDMDTDHQHLVVPMQRTGYWRWYDETMMLGILECLQRVRRMEFEMC